MNSGNTDLRDGGSPQFELDFPILDDGGRIEGRPLALMIRASARARRLSIRVYPDARVVVVVPRGVPSREVERFVAEHREWIDSKRAQALGSRPEPQAFPPPVIDLRLTGDRLCLQVVGGGGRARISQTRAPGGEGQLRVSGPVSSRALRRSLRAWLMRVARETLEPRVAALASETGVRYARVSIRRQRSRWGSCSVRGTISLNCCLLFQSAEVVDYLIIHELMHVKHMNHSAHFWQAVERHCAGWRELDRELVQGWRHVPRWVFSEES
jgi:predicted metal-dependent hydrolase